MRGRFIFAVLLVCQAAICDSGIFPLSEVKAGLRGYGKTVFSGYQVEKFGVEILGVLENVGPKQSMILARLSGGPLAEAGVVQGMSGSPVYIDGRLAGAVAMAFPFSKQPIAGIRPIEEMLRVREPAGNRVASGMMAAPPSGGPETAAEQPRLIDIATPISFSGFTSSTLQHFGAQLRSLGLEPRQAVSGGGRPSEPGTRARIEPGAMISVQLISGDLSVGADGTVTHVDGNRVYAFGHRLLSAGDVEMPFALSEVLTILPNVNSSFKISSAREWAGAITQDRNAALGGVIGKKPAMLPVSITVTSGGRQSRYGMEMVHERFLSPFLLQMAVYSAIDSTERTVGASTLRIQGQVDFQGMKVPVKYENMYAAEFGAPALASLGAVQPLMYAMQSGLPDLKVQSVSLHITATQGKNLYQIDRVHPAKAAVRPGEAVELLITLAAENGAESVKRVRYPVPIGAALGTLYFTVADGMIANATDARQWTGGQAKTGAQLVATLNAMRRNNSAWVRIWKADPSYVVQGEDISGPPPSVALILSRAQGALGAQTLARSSKIAEIEVPLGEAVVSGSRTVQVEVKE